MSQLAVAHSDTNTITLTRAVGRTEIGVNSDVPTAPVAVVSAPAAAAAPRKRSSVGGVSGRVKWKHANLRVLLTATREILPAGSDGWEHVARRCNEATAGVVRDGEQCSRKFKQLCKMTKGQTGDPHLPALIEDAVQTEELIKQRYGFVASGLRASVAPSAAASAISSPQPPATAAAAAAVADGIFSDHVDMSEPATSSNSSISSLTRKRRRTEHDTHQLVADVIALEARRVERESQRDEERHEQNKLLTTAIASLCQTNTLIARMLAQQQQS